MSRSQEARVKTEEWVARHGYCLACDSSELQQTKANTKAQDFVCPKCRHPYELKASAKDFRSRIVDGAYSAMMGRIWDKEPSSFFMMHYAANWVPLNLFAIPRAFVLPEVIEARKPLSPAAKRAGWIGCNILLNRVPPEGRIALIDAGVVLPSEQPRQLFRAAEKLHRTPLAARGWTTALLTRLHRFGTAHFTIEQVYALQQEMESLFPENKHVRAKLRQQLQVLRDAGMLSFEERGVYRLALPLNK